MSPSQKPHAGFICMSTVEDLSYTPSAEEKNRDAAQIIATGRRSWKTLKGRGEAVWPPHLEAALIEALGKYKPDESRSNKTLGRFSMRNRFISDYIFESTGKRRTPKQVGSRLQQLRDTCKSDKIMSLISRRNVDTDGESGGSSYSASPSTSPAPEYHLPSGRKTIQVNLVLERSWASPPPVINLVNNEKVMPLIIHLAPLSDNTHQPSVGASLLSHLEPTVSIASPFALERHCTFSVYLDGTERSVHTESASLMMHSPAQNSANMYSACLVPEFWHTLCENAAPTRFTVVQTLYLTLRNHPTISIIYNFTYPETSTEMLPTLPTYSMAGYPSMNETLVGPAPHWNADSVNSSDIDWTSSFNDPYSQLNAPGLNSDLSARYELPTISRSGRGLTESWVNGSRYSLSNLPYC